MNFKKFLIKSDQNSNIELLEENFSNLVDTFFLLEDAVSTDAMGKILKRIEVARNDLKIISRIKGMSPEDRQRYMPKNSYDNYIAKIKENLAAIQKGIKSIAVENEIELEIPKTDKISAKRSKSGSKTPEIPPVVEPKNPEPEKELSKNKEIPKLTNAVTSPGKIKLKPKGEEYLYQGIKKTLEYITNAEKQFGKIKGKTNVPDDVYNKLPANIKSNEMSITKKMYHIEDTITYLEDAKRNINIILDYLKRAVK